MKSNKRGVFAAILLFIAVGNYARMDDGNEIRTVTFLSIFAIGALSAITVRELLGRIGKK
jgi:hypothetical protein